MKYQSWSEVPKKGEPEDHKLAVRQIEKWFYDNRYHDTLTLKDYKIKFKQAFIDKHKLQYTFHEYDLVVFNYPTKFPEFYERKHILYVIEVNQPYDDIVRFIPEGTEVTRNLKISKSRHTKDQQTRNDHISEDYIHEYYPDAQYITIDKSDCFNKEMLDKILNVSDRV